MFSKISIVVCLCLPTTGLAQTQSPSDASYLAEIDFTQSNRTEFIDQQKELLRATWAPTMLLFTRINPSLSDTVAEVPWNEDYETAFGCMHDMMSEQAALEAANTRLQASITMIEYIYEHPSVTFASLDEHAELMNLMVPEPIYATAASECGLLALNAEIMRERGLMDAMVNAQSN